MWWFLKENIPSTSNYFKLNCRSSFTLTYLRGNISYETIHDVKIKIHNSLWIKPTDALNSKFIGITTLHVSGSLSAHHQEFLDVHRHWYILYSCDDRLLPGTGLNIQFQPAPGNKWSSKLHKMYQCRYTAKNSWWWAERLPETCRVVIPINVEFSASVGFIHKELVTMRVLWS